MCFPPYSLWLLVAASEVARGLKPIIAIAKPTVLPLTMALSRRAAPRTRRYIWETRIRDNSHLGVVDVSCQPAKAKVGKRKPSLLAAQQKEENAAQRLATQQQQHFQRQQQQQQAYMQVCACFIFFFATRFKRRASALGAERDVFFHAKRDGCFIFILCFPSWSNGVSVIT